MGVKIRLLRVLLILLSSLLSACVTAFAGPISFVGIAVPHLVKTAMKTAKPLLLIPGCFLGGAIITLFCDGFARTVFAPTELSISSVTAVFLVPEICRGETSETMQYLLEKVVSEGGGKNAKIEGYAIGGKTATSQTLPRSEHRYISSFLGFAPADDPKVLVIAIINNPKGTYYGGLIAAPVVKEIMENILPYLDKS